MLDSSKKAVLKDANGNCGNVLKLYAQINAPLEIKRY